MVAFKVGARAKDVQDPEKPHTFQNYYAAGACRLCGNGKRHPLHNPPASDATVLRRSVRDRSAASDALRTALRSYAKDERATDGAVSYGFATLLAVLLAWYRAQHLPPQNYDLETYQPARKTF